MSVVGYLRVSSDQQNVASQKVGIDNYCLGNHLTIDRWVEEAVSGVKEIKKRKLGGLIPNLQKGDTLIVAEISRLGRSIRMLVDVIDRLLKRGIRIILVKQGMVLDPGADGVASIQTKVFITVFALCAELERDLLRVRVKEGIQRKIQEGYDWGGERKGPRKSKVKPLMEAMVELRNQGLTNIKIAKKLKVSKWSVYRYLKAYDINGRPPFFGGPLFLFFLFKAFHYCRKPFRFGFPFFLDAWGRVLDTLFLPFNILQGVLGIHE